MHRLPVLKNCKNPKLTNCPDNFTPDGKWILGETPEVNNYRFLIIKLINFYTILSVIINIFN